MATVAPSTLSGVKNEGTQRQDNWWLEPTLIVLGLTAFAVYATYRAFSGFVDAELAAQLSQNKVITSLINFKDFALSPKYIEDLWRLILGAPEGYKFSPFAQSAHDYLQNHHHYVERMGYLYTGNGAHYISPFASPDLTPFLLPIVAPLTIFLQQTLGWNWMVISPALWILWVPGGFRLTCYYYRKAYYRSFFAAPTACGTHATSPVNAVTSPVLGGLLGKGSNYRGEQIFPLVMQNLHRYFFYISALFILLLSLDAFISYFFKAENGFFFGQWNFGIRAGSIILTLNALFLGLYTFSCHSYRHILGGMLDSFSSCGAVGMMRNHAWQRQSKLNEYHMEFAWISLVWVGFTDFYIWQVSKGVWTDIDLLGPVVNLFIK